ncbi:Polyketide cyclase / dehydrase and lipid transport [Amycolatopsis arida]|uniref:Polyketide cyclase / dehydrase and lipid transport n=1 Tax=Amycolatopsis arida TaxID=587909 RepID=A0A1I5SGY8_9PSEU|nr:SRPBCC family protein [Amycolatopsis arida]TDX96477.1 polyketide cyclase/dehydrase/lipid transport protein [Amycolatopsis arida]SFP69983.1 Polyketide cyclase / dehydrase and lipid transport [Amycolatopsis arida]
MPSRTFSFEVNRVSSARPETLFRLETDGELWSSWARPLVLQSGWVRHGDPPPAGVGAVRRVGLWPVLLQERTVEYEPDRRHVYAFTGRIIPARDYRAEALFTPNAAGGTDLRWRGTFTAARPLVGAVTLRLLHAAIRFLSARLVRAAERAEHRDADA